MMNNQLPAHWSLRRKLLFSFSLVTLCIFGLALVLIVFGVPYTPFKGLLAGQTEAAMFNLSAAADSRKELLDQWLFERRGNLRLNAESPLLRKELQHLLLPPADEEETRDTLQRLQAYVHEMRESYYGEYSKVEIIRADSLDILVSTQPGDAGKNLSDIPLLRKISQLAVRDAIVKADEIGCTTSDLIFAQAVFQPASTDPSAILAILVLHNNMATIKTALLQKGPGRTGEVVLTDQNLQLMAPLRSPLPDGSIASPANFFYEADHTRLAARGVETVTESRDYRGLAVLAATRHLRITSELALGLSVEIEKSEIHQPIRQTLVAHILVMAGTLLIGTVLIGLVATRLSRPIAALSAAATAIASGDLTVRTVAGGSRELCELSESFNSMASRLEDWYKDLAAEVEKRTTELFASNRALRESNEKFLSLVASIPGHIAFVNADTLCYEFVNDQFQRSFGLAKEKIVGSHIRNIIGEANYQVALSYIAEVKRGKSITYENSFNLVSGKRWIQVNYSPVGDADGAVRSIVVLSLDITERRMAEEELRKSENHLRTLVQTIPDLVWLKDKNGVYLSCNDVFARFIGEDESQILGKTDYDFVTREEADSFKELDKKAIEAGKPISYEESVTFPDNGRHALLETCKTPMYDSDGTLVGVLGIGRDITERKKAEEENVRLQEQLQQVHKLEAIGQLAGGVAHDFNNMLGVILGHVELAMDQLTPSHPTYNDLTEIRRAAERSADITRQLLAFARKQTIAPRVIDLNETLEGMLKMLRRLIGENIDLVWIPGNGLWSTKIDPTQINQILVNLCINARAAISGSGTITVETANKTLDNEYAALHVDAVPGEYVKITVSDTGCGMDRLTLAHVFEPFFTTKGVGEGTGLGLSMVFGAVKQNNGCISVYSEPGYGTSFSIYLPRHCAGAEKNAPSRISDEVTTGQETILLVEDEPTILNITMSMLQRLGYTVLPCTGPHDAMRRAEEYPGNIDMLMTDVVMPRMNGRDLADRLLKKYPHMKCLFMSGYTATVINEHGILDDGVFFIQKPFLAKDLAMKVRQTIESKPGSAGRTPGSSEKSVEVTFNHT